MNLADAKRTSAAAPVVAVSELVFTIKEEQKTALKALDGRYVFNTFTRSLVKNSSVLPLAAGPLGAADVFPTGGVRL